MAKILLIEDESTLLSVYTEILESEGYEVSTANDGDIGLSKALNEPWDLMLLDIMLPKLDGLSLLRRLSDTDKILGRPIIILSNLDSLSVTSEALKLGAVKHVCKSDVTPAIVLSLIETYLNKDKVIQ